MPVARGAAYTVAGQWRQVGVAGVSCDVKRDTSRRDEFGRREEIFRDFGANSGKRSARGVILSFPVTTTSGLRVVGNVTPNPPSRSCTPCC